MSSTMVLPAGARGSSGGELGRGGAILGGGAAPLLAWEGAVGPWRPMEGRPPARSRPGPPSPFNARLTDLRSLPLPLLKASLVPIPRVPFSSPPPPPPHPNDPPPAPAPALISWTCAVRSGSGTRRPVSGSCLCLAWRVLLQGAAAALRFCSRILRLTGRPFPT